LLNAPGLGEVLRCMALMPKGADVELLSAAMNISPADAKEYLRSIERFSFVKVRRSYQKQHKDTYFLHDELYALLQQAAFVGRQGFVEKQGIYQRVIECYEELFKAVGLRLADLYGVIQAGGKGEIDYTALSGLIAQRTEYLLAVLHYRLRENSPKGYRRWYRFDHEATISGDLLMSRQLQLEMQAYLQDRAKDAASDTDNLDLDLVRWSMLLRPVKHAWAMSQHRKVLEEARKLEETYTTEMKDVVKRAMLVTWKVYSLTYSDLLSVHGELSSVIFELKAYCTDPVDDTCRWLVQVLLAFAYRVRGYAYRLRGLINDAVKDYRQAAVLLRQVDLKIEMATVNNDLGFALALQGKWADARSLVEDALQMRSNLGLGVQVAYSLNTLARIDTYEGLYRDAIEHATKSLNLFRAMEHRRGVGMALTALAEATRRQSGILTGVEAQGRVDGLNRAYEMADEALSIFEETGERPRQVEALIEKGCARRNGVRLLGETRSLVFGRDRWINESRDALEKAAKLAQDAGILYRQVDALVNLAWLGYYVGGEDGNAVQKDAEKRAGILLKDYELPDGKPRPEIYNKPEYQPLLSTQLGKLHILRGHQAYTSNSMAWKERIEDIQRVSDPVREVYATLAREYFLGLEHSALYSAEYRDMHLTQQQIFGYLKVFRSQNLDLLVEFLGQLEKEYDIPSPGSQLRQLLVKRALLIE
jgi:tetratricopeptide (TPR) repeat protein